MLSSLRNSTDSRRVDLRATAWKISRGVGGLQLHFVPALRRLKIREVYLFEVRLRGACPDGDLARRVALVELEVQEDSKCRELDLHQVGT